MNKRRFDRTYLSGNTLIGVVYQDNGSGRAYYLDRSDEWKPDDVGYNENAFYEDERFVVRSCCSGEYGGLLIFTDKKTKRLYICAATCAVSVNKLNGTYYVTSGMMHMGYWAQVIEIADPARLHKLNPDSLQSCFDYGMDFRGEKGKHLLKNVFSKGTQKILDSREIMPLTSFVFSDRLYHIYADNNGTYAGLIQGDSMICVDRILNNPLYTSGNDYYQYYRSSQSGVQCFRGPHYSGFLAIRKDTVSVITFVRK